MSSVRWSVYRGGDQETQALDGEVSGILEPEDGHRSKEGERESGDNEQIDDSSGGNLSTAAAEAAATAATAASSHHSIGEVSGTTGLDRPKI